jgi:hypothetical protein
MRGINCTLSLLSFAHLVLLSSGNPLLDRMQGAFTLSTCRRRMLASRPVHLQLMMHGTRRVRVSETLRG